MPIKHILRIEFKSVKKNFLLDKNTYTIGRNASNTIILHDRVVSRHHATLLRIQYKNNHQQEDVFWIVDGDLQGNRSTNGLFINGKRCLSHELKPGDMVYFGGIEATGKYDIVNDSSVDKNQDDFQSLIKENKQDFSQNNQDIYDYNLKYNLEKDKNTLVNSQETQTTLVNSQETQTTLVVNEELDKLTEEFLFRLTYSPRFLPHPIIEISLEGKIIYLNKIAQTKFSDLLTKGMEHPLLYLLIEQFKKTKNKIVVREVQQNREKFTEYAHYLSESKSIKVYVFDFSKRQKIETSLKESEEKYRAVVKQISEGLFIVDVKTKEILEANDAYLKLLGHTSEEILKLKLYDVVSLDRKILEKDLERILINKVDLVRESIHRHKNGSLINVEVSISLISYSSKQVFCFAVRDITERKRTEELLRYQAFHDLLTTLPNRKFFNEQLIIALANAKRYGHMLGVMFIDLDRFKHINDTLGHTVGDQLLQEVAKRLKSCLRAGDTVSRWGGDEFIILLHQINNVENAAKVANRILKKMEKPFILSKHKLHISLSIGISIYPSDGENPENLIKNADAALYKTKDSGGSYYHFYNSEITLKSKEIFQLENLLYSALEKNQFHLYYQPQVNIKTGAITGMEALLRWKHPRLGTIYPEKFIPLAEETGLIEKIGEWVLYQSCHQNKIWQDLGWEQLKISVNISSRQLQKPNLVSIIEQVLTETKLQPKYLELEITETAIIQNTDIGCKTLNQLEKMGVRISMDDFGRGYSSLSYLKNLPFHKIKIHQGFIKELDNNSEDIAIISAIVALGKGFHIKIIAEGVETQEQLQLLDALQCDEMQGYLFSPPLSVENATSFLKSNSTNKVKIDL